MARERVPGGVRGPRQPGATGGGAPRRGVALAALCCLAIPVSLGAMYSLAAATGLAGAGANGWTLRHLQAAFMAPSTWSAVAWTVWTATVATIAATLLALLTAAALARSPAVRLIALLPMAIPHAGAALAILLLLGQSGVLARLAFQVGWVARPADMPALVYDAPGTGLILAFIWKELPFLTFAAVAVLETRAHALEEAARTLGATAWQCWRRITAPLLLRGILPSAIAVLAFLLGQYEMALLLAPSDPLPLPLLTYERITDPDLARRGEAHVLALLALGMTVPLVLWHERARAREPRA